MQYHHPIAVSLSTEKASQGTPAMRPFRHGNSHCRLVNNIFRCEHLLFAHETIIMHYSNHKCIPGHHNTNVHGQKHSPSSSQNRNSKVARTLSLVNLSTTSPRFSGIKRSTNNRNIRIRKISGSLTHISSRAKRPSNAATDADPIANGLRRTSPSRKLANKEDTGGKDSE